MVITTTEGLRYMDEVKEADPIAVTVSLTSREAREVRWALRRSLEEWRNIRREQLISPDRYTEGQREMAEKGVSESHDLFVKFFEEGWDNNAG